MADYAFQEENMKAIADAIREKDGTSGLIMPIDFPDRIRAIYSSVIEGAGLPEGGSLGQVLGKASSEDGDVRWQTVVNSFNGRAGVVFPQEGDYTADDVGAVPTYRSVNNHALEADIWLTAEDVDALGKGEFENRYQAIEARFDNAESLISGNTQSVSQVKADLESQVSQLKILIEQIQSQTKTGITYGTSALVSNISPLDTGTIYVQYE